MLYKRSNKPNAHWWVRFTIRGIEVRQSSGTDRKELAEAFEQRLREAIWNEQNLGIEVHTWGEACERWFKEKAHKRSLDRDRIAIATLRIDSMVPLEEQIHRRLLCDSARELAVYRSILNACVRWGWLDKAPKVEMPHAEKHEPRCLTDDEFDRLLRELPPHAAQLARFAVATGLRRSNIFRARWDNIDSGRLLLRVQAADSKTGRGISVPLSKDALRVLKEQSGLHSEYVFTDDEGRAPIGSIKTCWGKAVKRAGLKGVRFHDLRHTWAARHTKAGTPPLILKELGGWSSMAMVERYAHLNPGHLAQWAENSSVKENRNDLSTAAKRNRRSARKGTRRKGAGKA